ncbi:MAG: hypothetical protein C4562_06090 [Actinobacteria bacterium]|nr:MAG: hypothetical protein C4562_06090 [Actinomycetota bacterium]
MAEKNSVSEESTKKEVEQITINQEAIIHSSPYTLIRQKESEISQKVLLSKKKAEEEVATARQEASKIKANTEKTAVKQVEELIQNSIKEAEAQAKEIAKSSPKKVEEIFKVGQSNFDKALTRCKKVIFG